MPASTKMTRKTNEDRPPNRNVGVLEADPVNSDINEKICKICSRSHLDENRLLIHLVMFHFEVSIGTLFFIYFPCVITYVFIESNKNLENIHYHSVFMHFVPHIVLQEYLLPD